MEIRKYPYFRFSVCCIGSPEPLKNWFEHFKERDIPCAIVRGTLGYSLWRAGGESTSYQDMANNEELRGDILEECHGFRDLSENASV